MIITGSPTYLHIVSDYTSSFVGATITPIPPVVLDRVGVGAIIIYYMYICRIHHLEEVLWLFFLLLVLFAAVGNAFHSFGDL